VSTFNRVLNADRYTRIKHCCRAGCYAVASHTRAGRHYCAEHMAAGWPEVTPDHVTAARTMMRMQMSLAEIAEQLGVSKSDLDGALWRFIDQPLGRQHTGDF
jgi:hypothetical protein